MLCFISIQVWCNVVTEHSVLAVDYLSAYSDKKLMAISHIYLNGSCKMSWLITTIVFLG